jgi:hypothetical protein
MRRLVALAAPSLLLAASLLLDCGGSIAGGPYNPPTPPPTSGVPTSAAAMTTPGADGGAPVDAMAAVKARGQLHGDPVMIPASGGRPQRFLVLLGSPQVARAAWIVTPNAAINATLPADDWPEGVKVDGATMQNGHLVYVLVETLQTMDQPAGVKAVWRIDADDGSVGSLDDNWRFVGVGTMDDVKARLAAPPPSALLRRDDMLATLKAASASLPALAKAFGEHGADYYTVWQGAIPQNVEHIADSKALAASKHARRMLAMVTAAGTQERCESSICWALDANGAPMGGVALAQDGGSTIIQGFVEGATPPAAGVGGTPKPVTAAPSPDATAQALREQIIETPTRMLGEAPLGTADGSIGVGEIGKRDDPSYHLFVVVHDGNFTRVYDEKTSVKGGLLPQAVRFADITGDGRTDVIIRSTGRWAADQTNITYTRALLAPSSVQTQDLQGDVASELAMAGTATIDDAVKAALAVATHGVTVADACRILPNLHSVDGFKKFSSPDARVVTYDQMDAPLLHGTVKTTQNLRPDDVAQLGRRCRQVTCDPARPFCEYVDVGGPSEIYWFGFAPDGTTAVLTGAGLYTGQ